MDTYTNETVISEELWRAWARKGKLREEARTRKLKVVAGIALGLLAFGSTVYVSFAK